MRKNFTKLISGITQYKKHVAAVASLMLVLAGSVYLYANIVAITPQSVVVSADFAVGGPSAGFKELNPIIIQEVDQKDFRTGGNGAFTITAPTGWIFRQSGVTPTVTSTGGGGSANVSTGAVTYSATTITIPVTVNGENRVDRVAISGVALQALSGTVLSSQAVTLSVSGLVVAGLNSPTTIASISQTHGSARKLAFGIQPTTTNIYAAIAPMTVLIQDWAGNTVTNATNSVSLAIGNNPSGGILTLGSSSHSNGVVTLTDYKIDASGSNYTLVASSQGLGSATSSAFTISSIPPILESIQAPCITIGDPEQVITLIGSNFARNASARINTSARPTEFISSTELRMTLLASDLATAGSKTISVRNVNPSGVNSNGLTMVVRDKFENVTISGITEEACTGVSYPYSGPTGYSNYVWTVTDGARIISGQGTRSISVVYDEIPSSGIVTLTVNAENACGISGTQDFDIRIKQTPPAVISIDPNASNIICEGSSVELKAPVAEPGEPAYTYQWKLGGTDIEGATSATYAATAAGTYTVVVFAENGCSKISSPGFAVGTTTALTQGDITGTTSYCQKTTASALTASVAGGLNQGGTTNNRPKTYLWEQSATGAEGTWETAAGTNTAASYTPSTATAGIMYYRRTVYAGGCQNTTAPVAVTVTPEILNNVVTGTQTVCSGSPIALLDGESATAGSETVEYLWEQSATGASGSWAPAEGVNNQEDYQPASRTVSATSSLFYQRRVRAGECTSFSNRVSVKVTAMPVATITQGTNTYFCYPGKAVLTAQAVTGYTYKWYRVMEEGEDVEVGTTQSISVGRVGEESAVDRYYVVATQVTDGNSCSTTSAPITVQETVVGNNILNGEDQLICYGATPEMLEGSTATSTLGTVSYQWEVSSNGATFTDIKDATDINLTLGAHTADRWYRRTATVGSCSITSDAIKVEVKPELKVTNIPTILTAVCNNTSFQFNPTGSVGGATFAWTRASVEGISNPAVTNGTGGISEMLVNTTSAPIDVTYTYTTSGNENCTGAPQNLVVRVYPTPLLSSSLTPDAICSGANFSYTARTAVLGSIRYDWVREEVAGISTTAPASGSATSTSGASINHPLTNTTASPINVKYTFTLTANGCSSMPQEVIVTVNPRPQLSSTLVPDAICSGATFTYAPTSETTGATFSWTRLAATNITSDGAATGTGGINQVLTNSGTAPVTVTYRYTTTYTADEISCSGSTQDVKVVVNPSPKLNSPLSASVCSGTPFVYNPTSLTTGTTITWVRQPAAGITSDGPSEGSGTINQTLTNSTASFVNVIFKVTSSANGCTGQTEDVVVRVNPKPVATFEARIGTNEVGSVIYSDGGNLTFTPTGNTPGTFSVVSPAGLDGFTTGSSTATLNPCTALGTATERTVTIRYTVTQGSGINACTTFEDKTFTLKRSNYTVIILADPYPTCRGQITQYTAYVYKDAARVIYPYLADANGIAVDVNGNRLGDQTLPITNPDYPFPNRESMPQVLYDNAWRYFQPVVEGGTLMPADNFNYQWTKNRTNFFGPNSPTIQNAGLSSLDYYAVEVTSKNSGCAQPITSKMTNRMYTSATVNYEVALSSDRTTICRGGGITLTADLNDAFAFWGDISLTLYWMLDRGGVISQLGETVYRSGDKIQFPTSGPAGGFLDGDKVFVEFSSALDQYNNANKCARGFITNIIPITVVGEQTMAAGGAYCAGGAGIPVLMNGSQQGVFYQLKRDGQPVGSPLAGTGSPLNFGNQTVAGAYTVEALAAVGTPACLEFGPVNVIVTPLPAVQTLTAANNGEFCAGGAGVPITLANSQSGVSYQLVRTVGSPTGNVGAPIIGDGQPIVFPAQTIAGTYQVIATTVAAAGTVAACPVTMGNVNVRINPLPTVAVNSPSTCVGSPATVTATPGVGTGPFTYTWTVPAGWTGPVPTTASFQTIVPGTYTVRVSDSKSCSSSAAATSIVTVNPLPEVTVNNPTICAVPGQMATVTADVKNGTGPFTYTWTVPAGATNPGNVASFQTDVAGDYTVRIADSRGCAASAATTSTVTINPVLNATGDILIYDAENNEVEAAEMKIGEKYTFRVKSNIVDANDTDVASIKWFMGDGLEENWVHMQTGGTEFVMTEPMPAVKVSIRCEIPTNPGTCYNVLANLFMVSTEVVVPLPVELIYFKAEKRGNDVAMEWATASEKDNKGFEVQVSIDGKNFRSLGFVESRVINSSMKQVYTFVDKENGKYGTRYYRLKQVDLDGKFEYFSTKAIQFGAVVANKVKAYPNPFHSEVELNIDSEMDGEVLVTVTNATGQQLLQRIVKVEKGANIEKLTLDPTLPRGIYIISTRMGEFNTHFKLLKQ